MEPFDEILHFWFGPEDAADYAEPKRKWFRGGPDFDAEIRRRFAALWRRAASGALDGLAEGRRRTLASVVLFDQFPRNMFRGRSEAYATDAEARALARLALEAGYDRDRPPVERTFLYLPFEHSEDLADQRLCVALFEAVPDHPRKQTAIDHAVQHLRIIERFGRFPHRNAILGRESTAEEIAWLEEGGERFGTDGKARDEAEAEE